MLKVSTITLLGKFDDVVQFQICLVLFFIRWGIWVLAGVGILYQQIFHEMFKMIDTIFYVVIGVMPSLAVIEMVSNCSQRFFPYNYCVI